MYARVHPSRVWHVHGMYRYELMLRAVLADGVVHPLEKSMLRDYAAKNEVSSSSLEKRPSRHAY